MSINAASEQASCPLDWRLFIPQEWDEDNESNQQRREKAKLPQDAHHVEKWRQALEMIDGLIGWAIEPPVILGDGAYGDITEFRCALQERELQYVLDVKSATSAYSEEVQPERPEWKRTGRPPKPRYRQEPSSLKELALATGKQAASHFSGEFVWGSSACGGCYAAITSSGFRRGWWSDRGVAELVA